MTNFLNWIENKFMPPLAKLAEQKHLKAVRDGVISTLSLIIIGCFFLVIGNPPIQSWADAIAPYVNQITIPFRITTGLMSLYAAYGMGYSLAKSYKLDGVSGGVLSLATFLMLTIPLNVDASLPEGEGIGWVLPMGNLGGSGMFSAILAMIFAVEVLRFFKEKKMMITMPEQVPESVARSFEALIPGAFVIIVVWVIRVLLGFDINSMLMSIFSPLNNILGNNLIGVLLPVVLITLLWAAGVHGVSVIGSIVRPMWLVMLEANGQALIDGAQPNELPYIAPEQFYQWLVWIGGSGATLSLCALLLFAKSAYLKQVGRFSIVPALFNINEPLIFGTPIVMNPILAIPFVLAPTVTTTISYFAVKFGIVNGFSVNAPWTLPAPVGAFLSASNDWKAAALVIINIILAGIIYYPFVKVYDKKMLEEENAQEQGTEEGETVTV
ncbi:PTS sugar transporter subunit IIC [Pisciglobus halotolerans]|uniref:Permease IIC component n=1 Tax=Pisciglobus halotolerans TaxID=745365 RepID=A0A1I3AXM6_9LACT|nr:PTS transporter subunit EIIC [Pisciglobus halotolerans]SFH54783.1 PTS system, cellobiose-specific IIC component [Pisciglobus halotolerans]